MDMTGGAGAGAAAIRIDAGHQIAHRALHHRPAQCDLDRLRAFVRLDEGDFGHQAAIICFMGIDISASFSAVTTAPSAISFLPIIYSGAALTASTAAATPSRRWKTANLRWPGSPRSTIRSPGRASPAIWSLRSYWSDQNQGTS